MRNIFRRHPRLCISSIAFLSLAAGTFAVGYFWAFFEDSLAMAIYTFLIAASSVAAAAALAQTLQENMSNQRIETAAQKLLGDAKEDTSARTADGPAGRLHADDDGGELAREVSRMPVSRLGEDDFHRLRTEAVRRLRDSLEELVSEGIEREVGPSIRQSGKVGEEVALLDEKIQQLQTHVFRQEERFSGELKKIDQRIDELEASL